MSTRQNIILLGFGLLLLTGCNPTIRLEVPPEPIKIVADITIKHEIRIIVEKEVAEIFADDEGLF